MAAAATSPPAAEASAVTPVEPSLPSFREESYFVTDLNEPEKKALQELKLRIELAIQNKGLLAAPSPAPLKSVDQVIDAALKDKSAPGKTNGNQAKNESGGDKFEQPQPELVIEMVVEQPAVEDVPVTEAPPATALAEEATKEVLVQEDAVPLEDLSLWGVPILHTKGDERTDVILLKFLRARDFKVNDAFTMLKDTILWRKSFEVDKLAEEEFHCSLEDVAYMYGIDKQGHPVCYNVYGVFQDADLYNEAFGDEAKIKKFLRWRVRLLEAGIQKLDFCPGGATSMVQITDLKNAPGPARKELRSASKQALSLLQDNYPEFVAKKVFINAPWYFSAIYSMFSPFLTQRTKSKFVVARAGKASEALFKLISPDNVPVKYGGLSRSDDSDFKDSNAKCMELIVKAGANQTIEISVTEAPSLVVWDLSVLGWNVISGAEYVPTAAHGYTTIIEKSRKMQASEQAIRNSFKASEAGKVVLIIDNTLSNKKKIAAYRYVVKAMQL